MRHSSSVPYRLKEVTRVWRQNYNPGPRTSGNYLRWLYRFAQYCDSCKLDERAEMTRLGADRFANWWQSHKNHRLHKASIKQLYSALHAWATGLSMLGESMPQWERPPSGPTFDAHFQPFAEYQRAVRGNCTGTIRMTVRLLAAFERYRRSHGHAGRPIRLTEIDHYIISCRRRFSRKTVVAICSAIRTYLRFLHVTGQADVDLSGSVIAPTVRPEERPYRGLPWADVQRILNAIDRTCPT